MVRRSLLLLTATALVVLLTAAIGWAQPGGYETPEPTEGTTTFPSPPPETDPPSTEPPPIVPPTGPPPSEPFVPPLDPPVDPPADPPFDPPSLAATGIAAVTAAAVAGLLVVAGVGILGVVRRRRGA